MSNEELALGTGLLLLGTNFIGFIYSYIVLYSDIFSKYRIQSTKYSNQILLKRLPLYLLNLFLLIVISAGSILLIGDFFDSDFPKWYILIFQVLFVFIIDDLWFYISHRYMHENKFLLKNIHSIHHRATTPFPLEYLYAHPIEWMIGMIGTALGFGIIFVFMPVNIFSLWLFGLIRNLHEIHIHSDLDIKSMNWIPFVSSTKNHDLHHSKLKGNYASTFTFWDTIFNTKFKHDE